LDIFIFCFVLGLFIIVVSFIFNFLGDLNLGGDVDVDVDHDIDFGMDHDIDFGMDHDIDFGMDHDIDVGHPDAGIGHADMDGDHSDMPTHGLSPISPLMVGMLFMFFGIGGVALEDNFTGNALLAAALVVGVAGMLGIRKALNVYFYESQADSNIRDRDLIGKEASVTIAIKNGSGQVVLPTTLGRQLFPANCSRDIPRTTPVKVLKKVGPVLIVEPLVKLPETAPEGGPGGAAPAAGTDVPGKGETGRTDEADGMDEEVGKEATGTLAGKHEEAEGSGSSPGADGAAPPTIIYDQRKILISDSVINRSNFSEIPDGNHGGHTASEEKESAARRMLEKERSDLEKELLGEILPAGEDEHPDTEPAKQGLTERDRKNKKSDVMNGKTENEETVQGKEGG